MYVCEISIIAIVKKETDDLYGTEIYLFIYFLRSTFILYHLSLSVILNDLL